MKIPIFDGAALEFLRKILNRPVGKKALKLQKEVCNLFAEETNSALMSFLVQRGFSTPIKESQMSYDSLQLDPQSSDIENVIEVRKKLYGLTVAEASNETLWAGLCMGPAWLYVRDRWGIKDNRDATRIKTHYMFGNGQRRSYTRNAMSRLWWIGQLTYNESNQEDPYEYTRFLLEKLDQVVAVLERNTSDSKRISFEIIEGIRNARARGYKVERNEIRELAKYINIVGGVDVLDLLPHGMITTKWLCRAMQVCPKIDTGDGDVVA